MERWTPSPWGPSPWGHPPHGPDKAPGFVSKVTATGARAHRQHRTALPAIAQRPLRGRLALFIFPLEMP